MPDSPASIKNELLLHETKMLFPLLPLARGQMLKVVVFIYLDNIDNIGIFIFLMSKLQIIQIIRSINIAG